MNNTKKEYEVIIIGGGVIGSSIAFHLSEKGQKNVLVIDKGFPLTGTSGSTQAWVWVHGKDPESYAAFNKYSAELYPYLEKKLGDIEYDRTGGITPICSMSELESAEKMVSAQNKAGIPVELLSQKEVLKKEPYFSPQVVGATYSPIDGNVNPFKLMERYVKVNQEKGIAYSFYNEVLQIKKNGNEFSVYSEKGVFRAEKVVLAGGPWSQQLGDLVNISIPINLVRGQVIVTEPLAPFLNHTIGGMMRQMKCGPVLIGYSMEHVGYNRKSTLEVIRETARLGVRYIPKLAKVNVVRCFSGVRVEPQDGIPILGKIPEMDNLYIAVTHSGVTLSPLIGTIMSELITKDTTSVSIEDYRIERFSTLPIE